MENPNPTTINKVSSDVKADKVVTQAIDCSKKDADDSKVTDIQKKIRRAERFGISVQLSEQEKRNSRAQRFGTGSSLKSEEELKRKARAERFGLPVTADDEAKKKARLERFAPSSKKNVLEEDKMEEKDTRLSQPLSNSLSMNGKGNIETKAAIAGKAGGGS